MAMTHSPAHGPPPSSPPPDSAHTAEARRRQQSHLSAVVAAVVVLTGAVTIIGSLPLGYWTALGPGPGFFPLWLGILLAVLGVVWAVTEMRTWRAGAPARAADEDEEPPEYSLRTASAIVISLVVLAACLEVLGYQLSMLFFLLFHLLVLGKRGLLLSIVVALVGSFGVFMIFTLLLGVPLPASSIPLLRGWGL